MRRMTYREFLVWVDWLNEQWNRPSRTDHYLMQIAREVFCVLRSRVSLDLFKLPFIIKRLEAETTTNIDAKHEADQTALHKSKWLGATGFKRKKNG